MSMSHVFHTEKERDECLSHGLAVLSAEVAFYLWIGTAASSSGETNQTVTFMILFTGVGEDEVDEGCSVWLQSESTFN